MDKYAKRYALQITSVTGLAVVTGMTLGIYASYTSVIINLL